MTFSELVALLTPDNNGTLILRGSQLDTAAVTALFDAYFTDGTLVVANCTSTPDEPSQQVSVTGNLPAGTFVNLTAGVLTSGTFTLLPDGSVTVRLVVQVGDATWTLSKSFPQLAGSVFDQVLWTKPELTLDSTAPVVLPAGFGPAFGYPVNDPAVAQRVIKGLSLRATVNFQGYLSSLLAMFAPPIAVAGPIEVYLQTGTDDQDQPVKKVMPQLLLVPEGPAGLTRSVGTYEFTFALQLASLYQQFPGDLGALVAVIPTGLIAMRTSVITESLPPIPVAVYIYGGTSGRLLFNVGQPVGEPMRKQDIGQLLNGTGVGTLLEPGNGFPVYEFLIIEGISVAMRVVQEAIAINSMAVAASIGAGKNWSILDGLLTLDSIVFQVGVTLVGTSFSPYASVSAKAFLSGNEGIVLSAAVTLPDLTFFIQLDILVPIDLTALVHGLIGNAIPLPTITGASFAISGDIPTSSYAFETEIVQEWVLFGSLEKGLVLRKIGMNLSTLDNVVSGGVYGILTLAGAELSLSAAYDPTGWTFTGGTTPGQRVELTALFAELLQLFGVDLPPGLPLVYLDQLEATYTTSTGVFRVAGAVAVPAATYNLADLPLIGEWLDPSDRITLETITFTIQAGGGPAYVDFGFRVGFGTNDFVTVVIPVVGRRPVAAPAFSVDGVRPQLNLTPPPPSYPVAGSGAWVPAQRAFGPLSVEKLGFILDERGIGVQFNASLSVTGVLLEALGLRMIVPLDEPFIPSFGIDGLAVTMKTSVLTIGGGLVRVANPDFMQFDGVLVVQAKKFGISAFGSYATSEPPSMFVFALVNVPIGGPPAFFINGFSGGFGFNRDLILPQLWEIPRYPLVAGANPSTNPFGFEPTLGDFLKVMDKYMGVSIGQYWVAAGIDVSSFNLLRSQILLTIAFGNRLQVGILGLSTLSIPPGVADPVARAQLALEAVFLPEEGILAIAAQLTPGSYVFAKENVLTGGFAFYLWFPPSDFSGDFVVTLGGYSPYFDRPAHYPTVPPLGLNWTVAGSPLIFKGGAYIALTPRAIMAGGFLLATWNTAAIKVSFSLSADFLIQWKPFYYQIRAGVSFNVRADVNLAIARITLSVTVGAELRIWGPPFAGEAHINLSVISFTISFGAAANVAPPPIGWPEFKTSFLPPPLSPLAKSARLAAAGATPTDSIVKALIASGLTQDLREQPAVPVDYTVDPQLLELYIQTVIPTKSVSFNGGTLPAHNGAFGIGPMAVPVDQLSSALTIELKLNGAPYGAIDARPVTDRAPKALWLKEAAPSQTLNEPALIDNVAQGVTLKPAPAIPAHSLPIEINTLLYSPEATERMAWGGNVAPVNNPYAGDNPWTALTGTVADPVISQVRADIIANLIFASMQVTPDLHVAPLTNPDTLNLLDPVVLAPLGYEGAQA
jgi:hypothetical protein